MKTPTAINQGLKNKKATLLAKLAELERATTDRDELVVENSADQLDMIRMAADRDLAVQRLNQNDRVLRAVLAALDALERGVYGNCADCEEPISPRRLEVLPWAQLCIRCQSERERAGDESAEPTLMRAA